MVTVNEAICGEGDGMVKRVGGKCWVNHICLQGVSMIFSLRHPGTVPVLNPTHVRTIEAFPKVSFPRDDQTM